MWELMDPIGLKLCDMARRKSSNLGHRELNGRHHLTVPGEHLLGVIQYCVSRLIFPDSLSSFISLITPWIPADSASSLSRH